MVTTLLYVSIYIGTYTLLYLEFLCALDRQAYEKYNMVTDHRFEPFSYFIGLVFFPLILVIFIVQKIFRELLR